jgi:transitional endoplasmic reticulum ATPase
MKMQKTLRNMPQPIANSALLYRDTWYSRPFVSLANGLALLCYIASSLASWLIACWWLIGALPFLQDTFASSRPMVITTLAVLMCVALAHFFLELFVHKPLAEPGWPCVAPIEPLFAGDIRQYGLKVIFQGGAAGPALIYGLLLTLSILYSMETGATVVMRDVWFAAASLGIGALGIVLDLYPPSLGVRIPSWQEFFAVRSEQDQREKQAQAIQSTQDSREQDYALPVAAQQSKIRFADIFGMQALKDKLIEPAQAALADRPDAKDAPRNGILLHGEPGNGKTVFAEALAGELQVPIIQMTYGDVSSKWVGEMPRVISNVFAYAKRTAPCVLFIDEIDSFITSRDQANGSSEDLKITNTLLTEIVSLRSHKVVLVGATNYLKNLDAAAIREGRFDFKVEVTPPDEPARLGLLQQGIKKYSPELDVDQDVLVSVAKRWNGFSVSRLMAVAKALPTIMAERRGQALRFEHWMLALREVQGRKGHVPSGTKTLQELILPVETKDAIGMVASRLRDVHKIEALGGTLPTGVLFHGPSGTGKTAAARALAMEAGWAFLSVAGPDLLADRKALDRLFSEAKDLRPTIVFIDEADDLLRSRQFSSTPDLCNKLLVLMDGTEERVKDVVVIAATNHPDQIDPALLRSGRFTEKVEFTPPPASEVPRFLSGWIKSRKVELADDLDIFDLADAFEGRTIADIEGALQYALNKAISEHATSGRPVITKEHVQAAARVVLAA